MLVLASSGLAYSAASFNTNPVIDGRFNRNGRSVPINPNVSRVGLLFSVAAVRHDHGDRELQIKAATFSGDQRMSAACGSPLRHNLWRGDAEWLGGVVSARRARGKSCAVGGQRWRFFVACCRAASDDNIRSRGGVSRQRTAQDSNSIRDPSNFVQARGLRRRNSRRP